MSERLPKNERKLTMKNVWRSYFLSQGNVQLQRGILNFHFGRNPRQDEIYQNLDDKEVDSLTDFVIRTATSSNHQETANEGVDSEIKRLKSRKIPIEGKGMGLVEIGHLILDCDRSFLGDNGRTRSNPNIPPDNIFHPRQSLILYFAGISRCEDSTNIFSVATDAADSLMIDLADNPGGNEEERKYQQISCKDLLEMSKQYTLDFPDKTEQIYPYIQHAQESLQALED